LGAEAQNITELWGTREQLGGQQTTFGATMPKKLLRRNLAKEDRNSSQTSF